jgi:hypothetical protein
MQQSAANKLLQRKSRNYATTTVRAASSGEYLGSKKKNSVDPGSDFEDNDIWIHTSPRRSYISSLSMTTKSIPACLVYQTENGTEQRFELGKEVTTIGRKEDRNIVLLCPQISKQHATVEKGDMG